MGVLDRLRASLTRAKTAVVGTAKRVGRNLLDLPKGLATAVASPFLARKEDALNNQATQRQAALIKQAKTEPDRLKRSLLFQQANQAGTVASPLLKFNPKITQPDYAKRIGGTFFDVATLGVGGAELKGGLQASKVAGTIGGREIAAEAGRRALVRGVEGAAFGGTRALSQGEKGKEVARQAGFGAVLGGILGGAEGGLAAVKASRTLKSKFKGAEVGTAEKIAAEGEKPPKLSEPTAAETAKVRLSEVSPATKAALRSSTKKGAIDLPKLTTTMDKLQRRIDVEIDPIKVKRLENKVAALGEVKDKLAAKIEAVPAKPSLKVTPADLKQAGVPTTTEIPLKQKQAAVAAANAEPITPKVEAPLKPAAAQASGVVAEKQNLIKKTVNTRGVLKNVEFTDKPIFEPGTKNPAPFATDPATRTLIVNQAEVDKDIQDLLKGQAISYQINGETKTFKAKPGETESDLLKRYLNEAVLPYEEQHVNNFTVGQGQDRLNGKSTEVAQQLDELAQKGKGYQPTPEETQSLIPTPNTFRASASNAIEDLQNRYTAKLDELSQVQSLIGKDTIANVKRLAKSKAAQAAGWDVAKIPGFDEVTSLLRDELHHPEWTTNDAFDYLVNLPNKSEIDKLKPPTLQAETPATTAQQLERRLLGETVVQQPGAAGESKFYLAKKYSAAGTPNDQVLMKAVPLAYQGNKRGMLGYITNLLGIKTRNINNVGEHALKGEITHVEDVFGGSGLVTSISKKIFPDAQHNLSDLGDKIVGYYDQIAKNPDLVKQRLSQILELEKKSKGFAWERQLAQLQPDLLNDPAYQAAKMIYQTNLSRQGGLITGSKVERILNAIDTQSKTLSGVKYAKGDAIQIIDRYISQGTTHDFLWIDPPYLWSSGYSSGKSLESAAGFASLLDKLPQLNDKGVKFMFFNSEPRFVAERLKAKIDSFANVSDAVKQEVKNTIDDQLKVLDDKLSQMSGDFTVVRNVKPKGGEGNRLELVITNSPTARGIKTEQDVTASVAKILKGQGNAGEFTPKETLEAAGKLNEAAKVRAGGEVVPHQIIKNAEAWKDSGSMMKTLTKLIDEVTVSDPKANGELKDFLTRNRADAVTELTAEHKTLRDSLETNIVDRLGIKSVEDRALVQQFGEKRLSLTDLKKQRPDTWQNVVEADQWFRKQYDTLFGRVNDVRERFGLNPIPKRKDYYTHFQEVGNLFEEMRKTNNIDPLFIGRDFGGPNSPFNPFAQQRKGGQFVDDAIKAYERYLGPTLNQIHVTESVVRHRALADALADKTLETKSLSSFILALRRHPDVLVGSKNFVDKTFDEVMKGVGLEKVSKVIDYIGGKFAANRIVGNLGTAIMQTSALPQAIGENGMFRVAKGIMTQVTDAIAGTDNAYKLSPFLRRRYTHIESVVPTAMQKGEKAVNAIMEAIESTITKGIWSASYDNVLSQGFKGRRAIQMADELTDKLVAGRALGEKPIAFTSRTLQLPLQFQLEVNNFYQYVRNDLKFGLKSPVKAAKVAVALYVMNQFYQNVLGRTPLPDPIRAVQDAYNTKGKNELDTWTQRVGRLAGEALGAQAGGQLVAGAVPDIQRKKFFGRAEVGIYSGGIPLASAIGSAIGKGTPAEKGKALIYDFLTPFGGAQVRKSITGYQAVKAGGVYDAKGNLKYPVTALSDKVRALLFGPSSPSTATDFYNKDQGKTFSETDTKAYQDLLAKGLSPKDALEKIRQIKGGRATTKANGGFDYINEQLTLEVNRAKRAKDAEAYNKASSQYVAELNQKLKEATNGTQRLNVLNKQRVLLYDAIRLDPSAQNLFVTDNKVKQIVDEIDNQIGDSATTADLKAKLIDQKEKLLAGFDKLMATVKKTKKAKGHKSKKGRSTSKTLKTVFRTRSALSRLKVKTGTPKFAKAKKIKRLALPRSTFASRFRRTKVRLG